MRRRRKIVLFVTVMSGVTALSLFTYVHRQWFLQDAQNGTVVANGTMTMPRAAHSATRLSNGEVLIAGGMERAEGDEINTASAEIYHPRTAAFITTSSMNSARAGHTATLLQNGDVLITGGFNEGRALASAEIYHPPTKSFSAISDMATARDRHSATLLRDGTVLITGGNPNQSILAIDTAEIYDPVSRAFLPAGKMTTMRSAHAATLLQDGSVLITGGSRQRFDEVMRSAEVYDPVSHRFHAIADMAVARHKHSSTLLADGRVLISGGSDDAREMGGRQATSEIFDQQRKTFLPTGRMVAARFKMTTAVVGLANGDVLIAGDGEYAETFHPRTSDYGTASGGMDDAWMYANAVALTDGSVLITGGYNGDMRITSGAWLYRLPQS
jgi:hypothetical protein